MVKDNSTKKRIRETALALFLEKSFEKVTISEICARSGVNKHTFYYYFKSKDDLLEHYYEVPCELSSADVSTILSSDSYVEQLWILNKKFIDFVTSSGVVIIRQIMIKNLTEDVGTFRLSDAKKKEMFLLQLGMIKNGQASGQFRNQTDPKALLILMQQSIHSTALMWSIKNGCFDYEQSVRYLFENVFDVDPKYKKVQKFPFEGIF